PPDTKRKDAGGSERTGCSRWTRPGVLTTAVGDLSSVVLPMSYVRRWYDTKIAFKIVLLIMIGLTDDLCKREIALPNHGRSRSTPQAMMDASKTVREEINVRRQIST
ncbi:unnamed protein product, partial [Musa acuminata var. zebrina]